MYLKKTKMFSTGNASACLPNPRSMTFKKSPKVVVLMAYAVLVWRLIPVSGSVEKNRKHTTAIAIMMSVCFHVSILDEPR